MECIGQSLFALKIKEEYNPSLYKYTLPKHSIKKIKQLFWYKDNGVSYPYISVL